MLRQYPFREPRQPEAKVKVKETDPTWSQFFPVSGAHPCGLGWRAPLGSCNGCPNLGVSALHQGYNEELCRAFPSLCAFQGACEFYVLPVTNKSPEEVT